MDDLEDLLFLEFLEEEEGRRSRKVKRQRRNDFLKRRKLIAAGLLTEDQASSSTQETILPNVLHSESLPGIYIKQEIIETEEEEPPNFIYSAFATPSGEIPSSGCPSSVPRTSAALPSQETLPSCISPSKKSHHTASDRADSSFSPPKDQFDIFGEIIAEELRKMDPNMSSIVQKVMSELVYEVKLGKILTDEEKTDVALKSSDFVKKISSPDNSNQKILPDIEDQMGELPNLVTTESHSVISSTPSSAVAPSERNQIVSVTPDTSYPQETVPTILTSSENAAKPDHQESTVQHSQPIDSMVFTEATQDKEIESAMLKSNNQSSSATETTHISKKLRTDKCSDIGLTRARDQNDIFGEFIVAELKKMDTILNSIVQNVIAELLFEAKLGMQLSSKEKTNLCRKRCFFISRLHSVDNNLNDKTNCSPDLSNQNLN